MSSALHQKSVRRPRSVRHNEAAVDAAHVAAAEPAVPEDAAVAAAVDVAGQVVDAAAQAAVAAADEVVRAADARAARVAHATERDVTVDAETVAAKAEASSSRT